MCPVHTIYAICKLGAHKAEPTKMQQGPIANARRKALGVVGGSYSSLPITVVKGILT